MSISESRSWLFIVKTLFSDQTGSGWKFLMKSSESESPGVMVRGTGAESNEGNAEGNDGAPEYRFDDGEVLRGRDCRRFCEKY